MSFECLPRVSVTILDTDSESGRAGFKVFVVCRHYTNPDTIAMRRSEAVHAHCCEHALLCYIKPAVVFAWGERTAAPRSLTSLLHAVLKGQCHEIFDFCFFFMNQFPPSP